MLDEVIAVSSAKVANIVVLDCGKSVVYKI